jgi:hypothetical protein
MHPGEMAVAVSGTGKGIFVKHLFCCCRCIELAASCGVQCNGAEGTLAFWLDLTESSKKKSSVTGFWLFWWWNAFQLWLYFVVASLLVVAIRQFLFTTAILLIGYCLNKSHFSENRICLACWLSGWHDTILEEQMFHQFWF